MIVQNFIDTRGSTIAKRLFREPRDDLFTNRAIAARIARRIEEEKVEMDNVEECDT